MKQWKAMTLRFGGFAAVVALYTGLALFGIGCPIRAVTGISCAGCGMTRAFLALLRLDFRAAFYYHPLFWMVPLALALLFIKKGSFANPKVRTILWTVMIAVTVAIYILRLLAWKDSAIYIRG